MRGLRAIAKDRGWDVRHVFLRDDLRVEAEAWTAALAELTKQSVVFVDGFDHLWWWRRVEAITRTSRVGLVVTGHRRMVLMRTVVRTQTSVDLLAGLVRGLVGEGEIEAVDRAEVGAMYRTHGGNVRDALWAFYDRWAEG